MSNLLTNMNGIVTINGSSRQICQVSNHERNEYELIYEPTELIGDKNYILIHVAYNQDIYHTLFFPIQSLGKQVVPFEIEAENIIYFDVNFYGTMKLKDTSLSPALTEVDKVSNDLKDAVENINSNISNMEEAIKDGMIETFYQSTEPVGKVGDVWFNTSNGLAYRHNGTKWNSIQDKSVIEALDKAQNAQTTADGKIKTYYQKDKPAMTPNKDIGDLWIDTDDNNKLYRWDGTQWIDIHDKSIDSVSSNLSNAISSINSNISDLEKAIEDGRIEIFYQTTQPIGSLGDLWYDTSVINGIKSDKCYRHNGSKWELVKDSSVSDAIKKANEAQATADGKIVTFYQNSMPSTGSYGDLWIDTGNGNKLYRHDGKTFVDVSDKTISEIKDIITNNKSEWDKIKEITDNVGNVVANKLTGAINLNKSNITNSTGRFTQTDTGAMWVSENDAFASVWNEHGIHFANSKDSNGDWIWQNAIGWNGVVATKVVAEALYGLTVNALNLTSTNITSGNITGVEISGSKFTSSDGTKTMSLEGGRIDFREGRMAGILKTDQLSLFGTNHAVELYAYGNMAMGEGSMLFSNNTLIVGNTGYHNNIKLRNDGYIDLDTPFGSTRCTGNFEVWGDKNSVIPTQHYGVRALYAEEADKSYFSTKGIIDITGTEHKVELDPIFLETIEHNSSYPYIILLTPYSDAHVYVSEVTDTYFTVKSNKHTKVAYDLKAIRVSYGNVYLEEKENYTNKQLTKIQQAAIKRMGV